MGTHLLDGARAGVRRGLLLQAAGRALDIHGPFSYKALSNMDTFAYKSPNNKDTLYVQH